MQTATKLTYAEVLANGKSSRAETKNLQIRMDFEARGQLKKQIIPDGDDSTREKASKLTPKEIISKVNLALDKLKKDMAATLKEDNNERPENRAEWLKHVAIKENIYQVVVQFLSTRLCNCLEKFFTTIEAENHRTPGQSTRNPANGAPIKRNLTNSFRNRETLKYWLR